MTPVPPRTNMSDSSNIRDEDTTLGEYERDGWTIGFEVAMNGVTITNAEDVNSNDDSDSSGFTSDSESEQEKETVDSDSENPYSGYEQVPMNNDEETEGNNEDNEENEMKEQEGVLYTSPENNFSFVPSKIKEEFDKLMTQKPSYEHDLQAHEPNDIPLDSEKTNQIKAAMSNFKLLNSNNTLPVNDDDFLNTVKKVLAKS